MDQSWVLERCRTHCFCGKKAASRRALSDFAEHEWCTDGRNDRKRTLGKGKLRCPPQPRIAGAQQAERSAKTIPIELSPMSASQKNQESPWWRPIRSMPRASGSPTGS
jgi:hypothetical protein